MACHTTVAPWVPTDKNSVSTDSEHSVHNFTVAKALTQSLSGAAWHSKRRRTRHHTPRGPSPSALRAGTSSRRKRSRTAFASRAYLSVYELTHRTPGSRRAAGSEKHSNGMPRICWHTIFICGNPRWHGKPLKQLGFLSRSGGHSSRCWYRKDSVFARIESRSCCFALSRLSLISLSPTD